MLSHLPAFFSLAGVLFQSFAIRWAKTILTSSLAVLVIHQLSVFNMISGVRMSAVYCCSEHLSIVTINGRVIYTAPYVRNDFDAGNSITRAIGRALNIETFLGPKMASSRQASAISRPKKIAMFRALPMAQVMDLPA